MAVCIDTFGSFTCACPVGFTLANDGSCIDVDECALGGHNCDVGETCLNLPGSVACFTIPRTTIIPAVEGDPHVRVQHGDEDPVCFDIDDEDGAVLDLVSDLDTGLEVNGQLISVSKKKHVARLERVGILTPAGVEIGVYPDRVTIGKGRRTLQAFLFDDDYEMGLDDCHIIVHALKKGQPKRGVTVSVGDFSELRFNVWIKNKKDSMSFQIERSDGLGENLTGILGETMRGNNPYTINEDGSITVTKGTIESHEYYWSSEHLCHQITDPEAVERFLGHSVADFRVPSLFERLVPEWVNGLAEMIWPKRK